MPVPRTLLARDSALRKELGAPDVRHLLVIEGKDAQSVLKKAAALDPKLKVLVDRGLLDGYDQPARYLPTKAIQEQRRAALPDPDKLRAALDAALLTTPFKAGVFEPFMADVERARQLPALDPADLAGSPLETRVGSLLLERGDHWTGLVTLAGVKDVTALEQLADQDPGTTLLDLKQASEDLVARQRDRILWCLAISAVLLVSVVFVALRDASRVRRVLAPMALTTLIIVALFHATGVSLSLFHLIALVLAAGLGLDYALFFEHAADDPAEQRRTLHAVIVCSLSTLLVFALLGLSTLPVLRAIGITVAAGVVCNFVLALLLTRPRGSMTNGR
jgi:predicted exporter